MSINSIGSIKDHTPNYKLIIPRFDLATWHDYIEENFRNIDALFFNLFGINNYSGSWKQITEYTQGQVLFIGDDLDINGNVTEFSGRLVKVLVDHVTDNSDYFNVFYNLHPEYYEMFADASTAQVYAQQAQSYKNETEILKNETSIIKEETNSIKDDTNLIKSDIITKQNEINNTISSFNEDFSEKTEQIDQKIEDGKTIIDQKIAISEENVEKSRIWAEGEQSEVELLGGELSSKEWNNLAQEEANNAKTNADRAERIAQEFDGVVNTIEGCIGDIGFAPLGIDETQNRRRYLNGQVISQSQFVSFTNKIKSAIELYPNIATSEINWQAEVTNSKLGQCGKFVIDDTAGTIRLPKVVNIQGLQDLALMGSIKAESLPNITGGYAGSTNSETGGSSATYGAFYVDQSGYKNAGQSNSAGYIMRFDASRSSSTYKDNAPVQQEAVQYPYFIQVATGTEESVDVTREIELNNPFSLLDYKWSEYELNNASWLISNGAFHSGATYVAVYELLLKIYNGTETKDGVSVKLSTEEYTDTDFVINTADTTFRLPIKVKLASGNAVVGNGMALGLTDGTRELWMRATTNNGPESQLAFRGADSNLGSTQGDVFGQNGVGVGITTDPTKSGIETSSNGLKLYFYVGETVQDANVIAASQVLGSIPRLQNEINDISSKGLGYPTQEVIAQEWGTWTAPDNGFACLKGNNSGDDHAYYFIYNTTTNMGNYAGAWNGGSTKYCSISVSKGDVVAVGGNRIANYSTFFVRGK